MQLGYYWEERRCPAGSQLAGLAGLAVHARALFDAYAAPPLTNGHETWRPDRSRPTPVAISVPDHRPTSHRRSCLATTVYTQPGYQRRLHLSANESWARAEMHRDAVADSEPQGQAMAALAVQCERALLVCSQTVSTTARAGETPFGRSQLPFSACTAGYLTQMHYLNLGWLSAGSVLAVLVAQASEWWAVLTAARSSGSCGLLALYMIAQLRQGALAHHVAVGPLAVLPWACIGGSTNGSTRLLTRPNEHAPDSETAEFPPRSPCPAGHGALQLPPSLSASASERLHHAAAAA
jgi:hypothetical protein